MDEADKEERACGTDNQDFATVTNILPQPPSTGDRNNCKNRYPYSRSPNTQYWIFQESRSKEADEEYRRDNHIKWFSERISQKMYDDRKGHR